MTGTNEPKRKYNSEEETIFFYWLGYRFFTMALRGHVAGHKNPLSTMRDYMHVQSMDEGIDRDACEFLNEVAKIGNRSRPSLTLKQVFEKWSTVADWRPGP